MTAIAELRSAASAPGACDLTSRDRMVWNVFASWAGHAVFVVAGSIMPRQIDQHIAQIDLGVWDFGWVAVNDFFQAQVGVGVAINRYAAKHRAVGDVEGLTWMISGATALQLVTAGIVRRRRLSSERRELVLKRLNRRAAVPVSAEPGKV